MQLSKEGGPVWIPHSMKTRLTKLKMIPHEPYYKVIERLIEAYEDAE